MEKLKEIVCKAAGIELSEMFLNRNCENIDAKRVYYYLLKHESKLKISQIARMHKQNHATIIHHINKCEDMIFTNDKRTKDIFNEVYKLIAEYDNTNNQNE